MKIFRSSLKAAQALQGAEEKVGYGEVVAEADHGTITFYDTVSEQPITEREISSMVDPKLEISGCFKNFNEFITQ